LSFDSLGNKDPATLAAGKVKLDPRLSEVAKPAICVCGKGMIREARPSPMWDLIVAVSEQTL